MLWKEWRKDISSDFDFILCTGLLDDEIEQPETYKDQFEDFSKDSRIIGIDLNPSAKKLEKYGFEIYIGNQTKKEFWDIFYSKVGKIDILLDDGGHKNLQPVSTVHYSLPHVKDDG